MKQKIETIKTESNIDCKIEDYSYQDFLTPKLDDFNGDFDQNIINEIVLWKVNRYALVDKETLALLNQIKKEDEVLNEKLTRETFMAFAQQFHGLFSVKN